jgi:hypothetical protein
MSLNPPLERAADLSDPIWHFSRWQSPGQRMLINEMCTTLHPVIGLTFAIFWPLIHFGVNNVRLISSENKSNSRVVKMNQIIKSVMTFHDK